MAKTQLADEQSFQKLPSDEASTQNLMSTPGMVTQQKVEKLSLIPFKKKERTRDPYKASSDF